eukprot:TRINITY_DN23532_c0_g1_i1.p1 TRINITY_DN23532_c0_g1~~TRINITY_DN23532_c0_g1_i1.p1  ORF type:complete len:353 (+),score=83.17 TRINITY_DN23532_c0_g1_i1:80-1138(+)
MPHASAGSARRPQPPPPQPLARSRSKLNRLGSSVAASITFADAADRERVSVPVWCAPAGSGECRMLYVFSRNDAVRGEIVLSTAPSERVEFRELTVALIGEMTTVGLDGTATVSEFQSHVHCLERGGEVDEVRVLQYAFDRVQRDAESYCGTSVRLRWLVRVTIHRSLLPDIVEEEELWVQTAAAEGPEARLQTKGTTPGMKAEVGALDLLHIEFQFEKRSYHLGEVVKGSLLFHMVRKITVKRADLCLIRRETFGKDAVYCCETVLQTEVMDGHPAHNTAVPIRLCLAAAPHLAPTMRHVREYFSVHYYLNLVITDTDDRRYYKQLEVTLWRKRPPQVQQPAPPAAASPAD